MKALLVVVLVAVMCFLVYMWNRYYFARTLECSLRYQKAAAAEMPMPKTISE
jgi:hypothetical protein